MEYTEQDLDRLIEDRLNDCTGLPNVCSLLGTSNGKHRIAKRIKELILNDGITDIDACLAQIESQMGE